MDEKTLDGVAEPSDKIQQALYRGIFEMLHGISERDLYYMREYDTMVDTINIRAHVQLDTGINNSTTNRTRTFVDQAIARFRSLRPSDLRRDIDAGELARRIQEIKAAYRRVARGIVIQRKLRRDETSRMGKGWSGCG